MVKFLTIFDNFGRLQDFKKPKTHRKSSYFTDITMCVPNRDFVDEKIINRPAENTPGGPRGGKIAPSGRTSQILSFGF